MNSAKSASSCSNSTKTFRSRFRGRVVVVAVTDVAVATTYIHWVCLLDKRHVPGACTRCRCSTLAVAALALWAWPPSWAWPFSWPSAWAFVSALALLLRYRLPI